MDPIVRRLFETRKLKESVEEYSLKSTSGIMYRAIVDYSEPLTTIKRISGYDFEGYDYYHYAYIHKDGFWYFIKPAPRNSDKTVIGEEEVVRKIKDSDIPDWRYIANVLANLDERAGLNSNDSED